MHAISPPQHILLAEDESDLAHLLKQFLEQKGFLVSIEHNGKAALEAYKNNRFDLCLIDVMLPQKSGFEVAKEIKLSNTGTPIIFLTAKCLTEDKITGLSLGADDYITKPFDVRELVLRINNILVRTSTKQAGFTIKIGEAEFNKSDNTLLTANRKIKLTTLEAKLLLYLYERKNTIVVRKEILEHIWGNADYFTERSMNVFVTRLRKHLLHEKRIRIESRRGTGIILYEDNAIT